MVSLKNKSELRCLAWASHEGMKTLEGEECGPGEEVRPTPSCVGSAVPSVTSHRVFRSDTYFELSFVCYVM